MAVSIQEKQKWNHSHVIPGRQDISDRMNSSSEKTGVFFYTLAMAVKSGSEERNRFCKLHSVS